jgi:hypothetical protein
LNYETNLCVIHKRKFWKLASGTQVSLVNEAPGPPSAWNADPMFLGKTATPWGLGSQAGQVKRNSRQPAIVNPKVRTDKFFHTIENVICTLGWKNFHLFFGKKCVAMAKQIFCIYLWTTWVTLVAHKFSVMRINYFT